MNQKDIAEDIILSYMDEDYGQPKEFTLIIVQPMSEPLKDAMNYKKIVEELLKNHE